MTIFQKNVDQTTQEYKVTTVVVSLITYLAALVSIIVVNWAHIKRKVLPWWTSPTSSPVKDKKRELHLSNTELII
jgi:hypothetical protein